MESCVQNLPPWPRPYFHQDIEWVDGRRWRVWLIHTSSKWCRCSNLHKNGLLLYTHHQKIPREVLGLSGASVDTLSLSLGGHQSNYKIRLVLVCQSWELAGAATHYCSIYDWCVICDESRLAEEQLASGSTHTLIDCRLNPGRSVCLHLRRAAMNDFLWNLWRLDNKSWKSLKCRHLRLELSFPPARIRFRHQHQHTANEACRHFELKLKRLKCLMIKGIASECWFIAAAMV